jgi:hypothetical protein
MPRPQFSLKSMLWLMAVLAAFLGGAATQWRRDASKIAELQSKLDDAEFAYHGEMKVAFDRGWHIEWLRAEIDGLNTERTVEELKKRLHDTPAP